MRAGDLMAVDVVAVPISATVEQAAEILRAAEVSGAPVVDGRGSPLGVISHTDLAWGWEQADVERRRSYYAGSEAELSAPAVGEPFGNRSIREVMMPVVFSVDRNDPIRKAAALMQAEGIHRVIVLEEGRLVGVLSASAIVAAVARGDLVERS